MSMFRFVQIKQGIFNWRKNIKEIDVLNNFDDFENENLFPKMDLKLQKSTVL